MTLFVASVFCQPIFVGLVLRAVTASPPRAKIAVLVRVVWGYAWSQPNVGVRIATFPTAPAATGKSITVATGE